MSSPRIEISDHVDFQVEVKRTSRKKSVGFRVSQGKVTVLAPKAMTAKELFLVIETKRRWIMTKLRDYVDQVEQGDQVAPRVMQYIDGEAITFLDDELTLRLRKGAFKAVCDGHELIVYLPQIKPEWVRNALERWYKQQAETHFAGRVAHYAPLVGAHPHAIQIKTYRARWGSCNTKRQLQFNWKLMMAPQAVVDSVVVHELCHLIHMHHGPAFWSEVKRVLPNYGDAKVWLREEGARLNLPVPSL